jgi:23S rRNA G2069 N7-methylase RlmK/C1962 C5-methylase RlmI
VRERARPTQRSRESERERDSQESSKERLREKGLLAVPSDNRSDWQAWDEGELEPHRRCDTERAERPGWTAPRYSHYYWTRNREHASSTVQKKRRSTKMTMTDEMTTMDGMKTMKTKQREKKRTREQKDKRVLPLLRVVQVD